LGGTDCGLLDQLNFLSLYRPENPMAHLRNLGIVTQKEDFFLLFFCICKIPNQSAFDKQHKPANKWG